MPINDPTYVSYRAMMIRCYRPGTNGYENYGGRGIRVCPRWQETWRNFLEDMGPRPKGKELSRIDNNGHYCPENCKWQTRKENGRNKRNNRFVTYFGKPTVMSEAIEKSGLNKSSVEALVHRGFSGDLADVAFVPRKKLNADQVRDIRSSKLPARPLARKFGVSRTLVRRIRQGIAWKHLT